jgi:hypothetical protein
MSAYLDDVYMDGEDAASVNVYLNRLCGTHKDLAVVLEVAHYNAIEQ